MGRLRLSHFFFYLNMFRKNYYMSYRSYYLYQKYQSINGSTPAPVYPMEYSYDGEGTMPTVVKSENDAACGYAPPSPPSPIDYSKEYLTIESLEDGNVIYWNNANSAITTTISASTDNGQTWTAYTSSTVGSGTTIATLNTGDKVLLKGINSTYASDIGRYNRFLSTKKYNVYGNIMSLLHGDSFVDKTLLQLSYTFQRLFHNTNVVDASNLILPATTLMTHCYWGMFWGCTNLTTAPELPATTLAYSCYGYMFAECTSLTTAPELPATTLTDYCYDGMFYECTSLNSITCLATDISATNCTNAWVSHVAASGTFVKASSMYDWETGGSGIPTNWTVQNA